MCVCVCVCVWQRGEARERGGAPPWVQYTSADERRISSCTKPNCPPRATLPFFHTASAPTDLANASAKVELEVERLSTPPVQLCFSSNGADLAAHAIEGFHRREAGSWREVIKQEEKKELAKKKEVEYELSKGSHESV